LPGFTVKEGSAVNVRSGPGTNYDVIGQLPVGAQRTVTGRTATNDWWQFAFNGKPGWVSNQVVTVNGRASIVAVAAIPPTPVLAPVPTAATGGSKVLRTKEISVCPSDSLAGFKNREILYVVDVGSNKETVVYSPHSNMAGTFRGYSWSPDGRQVAFAYIWNDSCEERSGQTAELVVVNVDGSNAHLVPVSGSGGYGPWLENPVWSPEGSRLAMHNDARGRNGVWIANADGSLFRFLEGSHVDESPCGWSLDGKWILLCAGDVLDVVTGQRFPRAQAATAVFGNQRYYPWR